MSLKQVATFLPDFFEPIVAALKEAEIEFEAEHLEFLSGPGFNLFVEESCYEAALDLISAASRHFIETQYNPYLYRGTKA